ncbi:MAG: N-acetylmuramoyl-L-alanine amidase [Bacteroidota bacterium]
MQLQTQENFTVKLKRKDRKVKQAGFIVLHQTFMPSVLVETGFLTNKNEGTYLNSSKGQTEMGKAIADAILAYKKDLKNNGIEVEDNLENVPEDTPVTINVPKEEKTPKVVDEVKPKPEKTSEVTETIKPPTTASGDLVFKVQLMASSKTIPLTKANFNGLDILSKEPFKNLYRYMYGNAKTYDEAKQLKTQADAKGYSTSYIVAYKKGVRVPLKEALK